MTIKSDEMKSLIEWPLKIETYTLTNNELLFMCEQERISSSCNFQSMTIVTMFKTYKKYLKVDPLKQ